MEVVKKVFIIILLFLLIPFLTNSYPFNVKNKDLSMVQADIKPLESDQILISFLPIPIGEATLIQLANNDFFLIDTGYVESTDELLYLLSQHGVGKIKGIILTNFDDEHIGGLEEILANFPVEYIYIPKLTASSFKIPESYISRVKHIAIGDELILPGNVHINILSPDNFLSLSPNANSLVFQLIHNEIKFLFTSAINAEVENVLIQKYNLNSEILKVSDFGSNTGSSPDFLRSVDAQVGIIFSSDEELYMLSDDVLERLHETWTDIYILKQYGEVQIISDGANYQLEVIKEDE